MSGDRAVFIWSTKDWHSNDHKNARINIEYDHASLIKWSPDSKAFIIRKVAENVVEAYKINKRNDGWIGGATKALTYPKFHDEEIVGLGISPDGKYIMTCSNKTDLVICDIKGTLLARLDTYLMNTFYASISPCGRFVSASGFAPDAKIWEVQFSKTGEFNQVVRAFELQGHTSGIHQVAFNNDTSRMATVSKDGSWKVFNVKVEFQKGEDPHLIETGKYKQDVGVSRIALSPAGDVVAIASGSSLSLYHADTAEQDVIIRNIFSGPINCVVFDSEGKYVLTAGEKHVRIFHNVTGFKAAAALARAKLSQPNNTAAMKERLNQQISEAEAIIASLTR